MRHSIRHYQDSQKDSLTHEKGQDVLDMMNYVFPVTQIKDSGYDDELLDNFDIKVVLHQENTAQ